MSSWEKFSDSGRKRSTNFTETCNLLSQYIKEKGSLRDVNPEIARNLEASGKPDAIRVTSTTTMDLLTNIENSVKTSTQRLLSMDLLPQNMFEGDTNKASSSKSTTSTEAKASQMTIFYAGEVLVFDDFPAEKAMEVFLLATKGADKIKAGGSVVSLSETVPNSGSENVHGLPQPQPQPKPQPQAQPQPQPEPNSSDLPIARRASLHRFLEKRKDRATARAPYQVQNPSASSSSKHEDQLGLKL